MHSIFIHALLLLAPPGLLAEYVASRPCSAISLVNALLVAYPTYHSTFVVSVLIYRIPPLHPLAIYSGSLPCKMSKFWIGFLSISGHQHEFIKALHDKYGDVVRIGMSSTFILSLLIELTADRAGSLKVRTRSLSAIHPLSPRCLARLA